MNHIETKMINHLINSLEIPGIVLDLRIFDGRRFKTLAENAPNKKFYGLESYNGLEEPSQIDLKNPSKNEIKKGQFKAHEKITKINLKDLNNIELINSNIDNFIKNSIIPNSSFSILDLKQYEPTKKALEYLFERTTYGGVIFIPHYEPNLKYASHYAITEWIEKNLENIDISRQMVVDGVREKFLAIKIFNPKNKPLNINYIHKNDEKVTIAMVLKTGGGVYDHNYVNALAKSIKENTTVNHELICLTDDSSGFSNNIDRVVKFNHDFPKWWGKIELFRTDIYDTKRVVYFDLDTLIKGNIDEILKYNGTFAGLRDFYALYSLGSGVMAWEVDKCNHIYKKFLPRSREIINNYAAGDQKWIDENKPSIEYLQDIYHNQILSYKRHFIEMKKYDIFEKAPVICFHGNPRIHSITDENIRKYWTP